MNDRAEAILIASSLWPLISEIEQVMDELALRILFLLGFAHLLITFRVRFDLIVLAILLIDLNVFVITHTCFGSQSLSP